MFLLLSGLVGHSSPQLLLLHYVALIPLSLLVDFAVLILLSIYSASFSLSLLSVGDIFYEPSFLSLCPENVSCSFFSARSNFLVVHTPLKKHPCYSHILSLIFSFN